MEKLTPETLKLLRAAQNLIDLYPRYRDDPSEEDLKAWRELEMSCEKIVKIYEKEYLE